MELIIGNKNYSSWSMRGWLILKAYGIEFTETRIALFTDEFHNRIGQLSPSRKVPALLDGEITVWDSLSICEYVNDTYLHGRAWPIDPADKAQARSVSCEMHSGFMALRNELPMNCRAKQQVEPSDEALKDIARIDQMWAELRQKHAPKGPWLFGDFSIADIMYIPVALRFMTYNIQLSDISNDYIACILSNEWVKEWVSDSQNEQEIIRFAEVGSTKD